MADRQGRGGMSLKIKAEASAGASIKATSTEMVALANRIGVMVEVPFNDVLLMAGPGGDPEKLVAGYQRMIGSRERFKFASSHMVPRLPEPVAAGDEAGGEA
jgi:hypothetical protein